MITVEKNDRCLLVPLFQSIEDSMVTACLQGYMGSSYADRLLDPTCALIVSGEYCFLAGDAGSKQAKKLVETIFNYIIGDETIAIYSDNELQWRNLLMSCPENQPVEVKRYGIMQKDYDFDRLQLQSFIDRLPRDFELQRFDSEMYRQAISEPWSKEFCETFLSEEDFLEKGFGFGVMHQGRLVSGASTMTVYDTGMEVQVTTREGFEGRGLAMACASALLMESMVRKLRPCWDAATLVSKHMALRLGYEYRGEYSTVRLHRFGHPAP